MRESLITLWHLKKSLRHVALDLRHFIILLLIVSFSYMSSWIGSTRTFAKKKTLENVEYFLVPTSTESVSSNLLDAFTVYVYSARMGIRTYYMDQSNLLLSLFQNNPQCYYLKEFPESGSQLDAESLYKSLAIKPKFSDIQKLAAGFFLYDESMNRMLTQTVEKAGIRSLFDIGVHLHCDLSGTEISNYVKEVRTYQAKTKKKNLNIYVMASNLDHIKMFGRMGDPSWKVSAMSKILTSDPQILLIQELAEIKILTAQSALILDYNDPTDRFITLMHRGVTGPEFLKLMSFKEWSLV